MIARYSLSIFAGTFHQNFYLQGTTVNWLRILMQRREMRKLRLVCPHCKRPASDAAFQRGRHMHGDETLVCEHCHEAGNVTFWRFEGFSQNSRPDMCVAAMDGAR